MLTPLSACALAPLVAGLLTCPVAAQAAQPATAQPTTTQRVAEFLAKRRDEFGFPGVCVAWVGRDGKSHALALGVSDREKKTAISTEDRLLSGSIGKTYVATVALQLVVEKKLALDARVSEYLGDREWFARLPNAKELTIRSLLNHTSGIPRYVFDKSFLAVVAKQPDKVWQPKELLSYVFDAKPQFAVGKGWSYADTNYIVLGVVLEKLLGTTYYKALQTRVLDKFGLEDTVPSDRRKIPGLIPGYTNMGKMFGIEDKTIKDGAFVINPQFEWCGGGLACTTADLAKWARIYGAATHWPAALRKQVFAGIPAPLGPNTSYGLGVIIRKTKRGDSVGHSGFMPGYMSEMRFYPQLGLAIAIQVNTDRRRELGMGTGGYLDAIVEIVAGPAAQAKSRAPIRDSRD